MSLTTEQLVKAEVAEGLATGIKFTGRVWTDVY